ncbi:hypothetical protein [Marinicella rhabdoformis]|uniref:hypothetical protein n=1 Tax=Marinicella rhabdoformis TaxID=2580566 RepID=UPI0012AEC3C3|nr:hypothetical protein [Marinicella rhabdoformis]
MKNIAAEKIKNTRLARKAQINSGLNHEIRALQRELVMNSFSVNFDQAKHKMLMDKLNMLKTEHRNIAKLNSHPAI